MIKFCSWDGDPAVWTPGEAWVLRNGAWSRVNSSEVGHEARVLSKAAFDAKFGSLPPLPKAAFHSGDIRAKASPPRPTAAEIARDPGCLDRWKLEYRDYCTWVTVELADLRAAERGPLTAAEHVVIEQRSGG